MKRCPKCNRSFDDETYFCLDDGTTLLLAGNTSENPLIFPTGDNTPTQFIPRPAAVTPSLEKDSSKWLYLIMGVMGAALAALAVFMFLPKNTETSKSESNAFRDAGQTSSPASPTAAESKQAATSTPFNSANPVNNISRAESNPGGNWTGNWSAPSGAYFTLNVSLTDDGTGKVQGQIEWTMQRTRRPEKMSKIGMTAVEYVSGQYNPATQTLTLKGYSKNDPNNVLVMTDNYRLTFSPGNRTLNGAARNGGKWDGKVNLSR